MAWRKAVRFFSGKFCRIGESSRGTPYQFSTVSGCLEKNKLIHFMLENGCNQSVAESVSFRNLVFLEFVSKLIRLELVLRSFDSWSWIKSQRKKVVVLKVFSESGLIFDDWESELVEVWFFYPFFLLLTLNNVLDTRSLLYEFSFLVFYPSIFELIRSLNDKAVFGVKRRDFSKNLSAKLV